MNPYTLKMIEAHLLENKSSNINTVPNHIDLPSNTNSKALQATSSFSLPRQHPSSAPCLVCTPATSGHTCPASPLLSSQEGPVGSIVGRPAEKKRPSATADARLSATAEARPSTTADPNHSHLASDWTIRSRPPGLRISGACPSVSVTESCLCRRH